jgi:N-acetylneuraminic acid mutarotase
MQVSKFVFFILVWVLGFENWVLSQQRWQSEAEFLGAARESSISFVISGKAYVGTGSNGSTRYRDLWEFNPQTQTWTQKANSPNNRSAAVGFALNDKGYLTTGWNGSTRFKDTWRYDPQANNWIRVADFGGDARTLAVAFVVGGQAFVGLGAGGGGIRFGDFWAYSPDTDTWTRKSNFGGVARSGALAFVWKGRAFVGTGNSGLSFLNDMWSYDLPTDTWEELSRPPFMARGSAVAASNQNSVYIGLGSNGVTRLADFWEFQPFSEQWIRVQNLTASGRDGALAFGLGDKIFVGLGNNGSNPLNDFWSFGYSCSEFQIQTNSLPQAVKNSNYFQQLQATGQVSKPFWKIVNGELPLGLSLDSLRGSIEGKPLIEGEYEFEVRAFTLEDLISPNSQIVASSSNYPPNERPEHAIDNDPKTKYLNFDRTKTFLTLDIRKQAYIRGFELITANDAPERDPLKLAISASNDNNFFTPVDTINFFCIENRLLKSRLPLDSKVPYQYVKVEFLDVCNLATANSVQMAEIQLKDFACSTTKTLKLKVSSGGNWTRRLDLPVFLRGAVAFQIQNTAYVCTGSHSKDPNSSQNSAQKSVWAYDGKVWTQKANFAGEARFSAVGFSSGNLGYLAAGTNGSQRFNDFWSYDPSADRWTRLEDVPFSPRSGAVGFALGSDLYVGLGNDGSLKKDFWRYSAGTWQIAPEFGGMALEFASAWSIGSSAYVALGKSPNGASSQFWRFQNNNWTRLTDFQGEARYSAVCFVWDTLAFVGLGQSETQFFEDFWLFSPQSQSWVRKSNLLGTNRVQAVGFALGSHGYVAGGLGQKEVWRYDLSCDLGSLTPQNGYALNKNEVFSTSFSQTGLESGNLNWQFLNPPPGLQIDNMGIINGTASQTGAFQTLVVASDGDCEQTAVIPFSITTLGTWYKSGNFGGASRQQSNGFWLGNFGYVAGGIDSLSIVRRDLWQYNPENGRWTQKNNLPQGRRAGMVSFVVGGKAYLGMGRIGIEFFKDIWEYDAANDSWKVLENEIPTFSGKESVVSFVIQDKAYLGLGFSDVFWDGEPFYVFDSKTRNWDITASFPYDFSLNYGAASDQNFGYVLTGDNFYHYDPSLNEWSTKTYPPVLPQTFISKMIGLQNKPYVLYRDGSLAMYDLASNSWVKKPKIPQNILESAEFSFQDTLYQISGKIGQTFTRQIWKYNPNTDCEVKIENRSLPYGIVDQVYATTSMSLSVSSLIGITWSAEGLPEGLKLDPASGVLSGTPSQKGSFKVSISAFYSTCSATENFTIEIRDAPVGVWQQRRGLPSELARRNAVSFTVFNQFFVGLGNDGKQLNDLWSYAPQTNTWQKRKDFPGKARELAQAFVINGLAYIGGGRDRLETFSDFWSYDPSSDTWRELAPLPVALESGVAFVAHENGYMGLGSAGKAIWRYSVAQNSWQQMRNFAGVARKGASVFEVEDMAYVGLGDEGTRFLKDFWRYEPQADTWVRVGDFPAEARSQAAAFGIDRFGWVGIGFNGKFLKDFWQYDTYNNEWVEVADFTGSARSGANVVAIGSRAYLALGFDSDRKADLWSYNPLGCNNVSILPNQLQSAIANTAYIVKLSQIGLPNSAAIWDVSGLPPGLIFDPKTNEIKGKSSQSGTFSLVVKVKTGLCEGKKQYSLTINEGNEIIAIAPFLPFTASDASVFVIGDTAYIVGGYSESVGLNAHVWKFNLINRTIERGADFAGGERFGAVGFSIGELGYVALGNNSELDFKDLWQYNPKTGDWTKLLDLPGLERNHAEAFVINGVAYIGSGKTLDQRYLSDWWAFNPQNNSYSPVASMPSARCGTLSWVLNDKGYVVSGEELNEDGLPKVADLMWIYDPKANSWHSKLLPFEFIKRRFGSGFTLDSKGYLAFGLSTEFDSLSSVGDLWSYDFQSDTWQEIISKQDFIFENRINAVAFAGKASGYLGLGQLFFFYSDILKFSPKCPSATILPQTLPDRVQGQPYQQQLEVQGLEGNFIKWNLNPILPLPEGLSFDSQTGLISGIPAESGPIQILVRADNKFCSASRIYFPNLTIWTPQGWSDGKPDEGRTAGIAAPYHTDIHGNFKAQNCFNASSLKVGSNGQIIITENLNNLGQVCVEGSVSASRVVGNPLEFVRVPSKPQSISIESYNGMDSSSILDISWKANSADSYKLVVLKAGAPVDPKTVLDGNIYTADPDWQGMGQIIDGGKAVYQGKSDFVQVSNLSGPYQNYFVSVFEYELNDNCGPIYSEAISNSLVADFSAENWDEVLLYPNPAKKSFQIESLGSHRAKLLNVSGSEVLSFEFQNLSRVDVSALPRGLYFLHLYSPKRSVVLKLILE